MAKSQTGANLEHAQCSLHDRDRRLGTNWHCSVREYTPGACSTGVPNCLSRLVGGTNQNAPVNMAPVGGDVVAAIALGVGIAAVGMEAITSPVAMSPAAMTVAMVRGLLLT